MMFKLSVLCFDLGKDWEFLFCSIRVYDQFNCFIFLINVFVGFVVFGDSDSMYAYGSGDMDLHWCISPIYLMICGSEFIGSSILVV